MGICERSNQNLTIEITLNNDHFNNLLVPLMRGIPPTEILPRADAQMKWSSLQSSRSSTATASGFTLDAITYRIAEPESEPDVQRIPTLCPSDVEIQAAGVRTWGCGFSTLLLEDDRTFIEKRVGRMTGYLGRGRCKRGIWLVR